VRRHHPQSMYFGGVGAALRLPSGDVEAAADPRRAGAALTSP
jgi:gamma-glutamyltranspeptidase/glutathione hydrolase